MESELPMKDQVLQVINNYEKAVNDPDSALWLSIWALDDPDLTILENDKPQQLGKDYVLQIAEWMKTAAQEKRQTWHTNQVFLMALDFAYTVSLRTEHNMPESRRESRVSMFMRRTKDEWKIIHCHFSFVPGP